MLEAGYYDLTLMGGDGEVEYSKKTAPRGKQWRVFELNK